MLRDSVYFTTLKSLDYNVVWDVTVVCPLADSYVASASREASLVAELAASKKMDKYTGLATAYHFQPIAVEMLGPIVLMQRYNSILLHESFIREDCPE